MFDPNRDCKHGLLARSYCADCEVLEAEELIAEKNKIIEQLQSDLDELRAFAAEVDDYLNINKHTSIGHQSILHRKARELREGNSSIVGYDPSREAQTVHEIIYELKKLKYVGVMPTNVRKHINKIIKTNQPTTQHGGGIDEY